MIQSGTHAGKTYVFPDMLCPFVLVIIFLSIFHLSFTMENSLKQFGENSKDFLCDVHKQRKLQTWVICPQNIVLDLEKMEIGSEKKVCDISKFESR